MKICVLQPDYTTTDVDYKNYDPPRSLSHLFPEAIMDHIFLNKLTTYKQLRELAKNGYDVFVNLCEGYLDWSVPSIDVIHSLELLNLPYTGPSSRLYDPPKELMKYVAYTAGIKTPSYVKVRETGQMPDLERLKFPLFVKPSKAGDSLGIDDSSLVNSIGEVQKKVKELLPEHDEVLIEEYIAGREFTVLVAADANKPRSCTVFEPIEYIFSGERKFKTYASKTTDLHPENNIPCTDVKLAKQLKDATMRIFNAFNGTGYARLDFRVNAKKEIYFLEINFTCSVFYREGYEGSADHILRFDRGQQFFLRHIIDEGIARHRNKQKPFALKGNAIAGYGIYATRRIMAGEIIFKGEEAPQRIVTREFVQKNWSESAREAFRRYAYPVSNRVFILWDNDPSEWAPQNHSCQPNTAYTGLNVYALNTIEPGEELTLDYATFLNDEMEPFVCNCGAPECRKLIKGKPGVTMLSMSKK